MAFSFFDSIPSPLRAPEAPILNPEVTIRVAISGFSPLAPPAPALGGGEKGGGERDEEAGAGGGSVRPPAPVFDEDLDRTGATGAVGEYPAELPPPPPASRCGLEAKYSSRSPKKASYPQCQCEQVPMVLRSKAEPTLSTVLLSAKRPNTPYLGGLTYLDMRDY